MELRFTKEKNIVDYQKLKFIMENATLIYYVKRWYYGKKPWYYEKILYYTVNYETLIYYGKKLWYYIKL